MTSISLNARHAFQPMNRNSLAFVDASCGAVSDSWAFLFG